MSQSRWFLPMVLVGGLLFGFGLAVSTMTHPEVVLAFLTGTDLGLVFVMGGGSVVAGLAFWGLPRLRSSAPLTGDSYGRRLKSFDRNVLIGGSIFGVGWGLSGICPGAAYASLGIGNWPILYGIGGMFIGAYLQGWYRTQRAPTPTRTPADD
jgi:YeeE/YedE family (DUF395).